MKVTVRVHGNWQLILPGGNVREELSVPEGSRVEDVLQLLKVTDLNIVLVAVNGTQANGSYALREQDEIEVYFPVDGG